MTNYNAVADQYASSWPTPTGSTSAGPTAAAPIGAGPPGGRRRLPRNPDRPADPGLRHPARPSLRDRHVRQRLHANRLACERADLVAAVAPVAGTHWASGVPCNPSRPVSVLQIHGTADPVVPFDGGPMVGRGGPSDIVSAPAWPTAGAPSTAARPRSTDQRRGGTLRPRPAAPAAPRWTSSASTVAVTSGQPFDASQASGQFFASPRLAGGSGVGHSGDRIDVKRP